MVAVPGLSFSSPWNLPGPEIEPESPALLAGKLSSIAPPAEYSEFFKFKYFLTCREHVSLVPVASWGASWCQGPQFPGEHFPSSEVIPGPYTLLLRCHFSGCVDLPRLPTLLSQPLAHSQGSACPGESEGGKKAADLYLLGLAASGRWGMETSQSPRSFDEVGLQVRTETQELS